MKNTFKAIRRVAAIFKIAGIIAIVAMIGFTMAACDPHNGGGGVLTVNNLPSAVGGVNVYSSTAAPTTKAEYWAAMTTLIASMPSGNNSPFNLVNVPDISTTFNGSGNRLVVISLASDETRFAIANFSNGSATLDWDSMTAFESLD